MSTILVTIFINKVYIVLILSKNSYNSVILDNNTYIMTHEELINLMAENATRMKEMQEESKKMKEESKRIQKETKEIKKMLIWMGVTQWDISENLIAENFQELFEEYWENITSLNRNVTAFDKNKPVAEFDIIAVNGTKVFVWETKTKLTQQSWKRVLKMPFLLMKSRFDFIKK